MNKATCLLVGISLLLAIPALASDAPDSFSITGVVQHLVVPPQRSYTFVSIIIGRDFPGNLPADVDKIRVEGPGGTCPLSLDDFKFVLRTREFWATLPGSPARGAYHITVGAGKAQGTFSTTFAQIEKILPPRALKSQAREDGLVATNRPAFSWESERGSGPCYYQLQIKDSSGNIKYRSAFVKNINLYHPLENVLEPDQEYSFRVRVFDRTDWSSTQNRSQSNWVSFKTAASLHYDYLPPDTTDDGWETAPINATNMRLAPLKSMLESILNKKTKDIHGVLLFKDGKLILEEYFEGYSRDNLHLVASVTKSVNSLLFGQAVDKGLIKDLDQPAWDFFPEYDNPADLAIKKKITIKHVLTMTAGLDWDYRSVPLESPDYPTQRMLASADPIGFILSREVVSPPGQVYNYNDGLSIMLGEMTKRVSGMTVNDCAEAWLFGPLGMKKYVWETIKNGITLTQGGLYLRPRDMGKIGQLVLQNGQWQGKQIVSKQWLRASTTEHIHGDGVGYGYQWRTAGIVQGGKHIRIVWASGYGGQRIFIVPDLALVAVITSKVLYNPEGGILAERLFVSNMLPAILLDDEAENPAAYTELRPGKIVGCYTTVQSDASGCIAHEGNKFYLYLKAMNREEKCELKPISKSELLGNSTNFGGFRIMLKWTAQGQLNQAVFQNGLRTLVMKKEN